MRVMIGTVVMRADDGSFLSGGTPIYRDLSEREGLTEPEDYYDLSDFAALMADKYDNYLVEKRKKGKETKGAKKENAAVRDTDSGGRRYEKNAH